MPSNSKTESAELRKTIIKTMAFALFNKDIDEKQVARMIKIINLWKSNLRHEKFTREQFFRNHKVGADEKLLFNSLLDTNICASVLLYS